MRRILFSAAVSTLATFMAAAQQTPAWQALPEVQIQLNNPCLQANVGGYIPIEFNQATTVLDRDLLMEALLSEYARRLPAERKFDWSAGETPAGRKTVSIKCRATTRILELYRSSPESGIQELVFLISCNQTIGDYDALVQLQLFQAAPGSAYCVKVLARPRTFASRLFAHTSDTIEARFLRHTQAVTAHVRGLFIQYCKQSGGTSEPAAASEPMREYRAPTYLMRQH